MTHPAAAALEYQLVGYRRTWRASALGTFVLPVLTMVGFGMGVGAHVEAGIDGVPYLDWMVPGLIAATALQVAIGEATFPVLSQFRWIRTYHALAASPLRMADIVAGQAAFMLFRVLTSCAAFLLVAALFGTLHSAWAPGTLAVAALLGAAVALPTFAFSAAVSSEHYLALLFRFGVLPMTLFAGVFFPVESLPGALRPLAYASPLWHAVDLSRAATLGTAPDFPATGHVLYLAGWAVAGWWLAVRTFRRRLVI